MDGSVIELNESKSTKEDVLRSKMTMKQVFRPIFDFKSFSGLKFVCIVNHCQEFASEGLKVDIKRLNRLKIDLKRQKEL